MQYDLTFLAEHMGGVAWGTVITLFIPCVANFLMIVKERGMKVGLGMSLFIILYAFGMGWAMNSILVALNLNLAG